MPVFPRPNMSRRAPRGFSLLLLVMIILGATLTATIVLTSSQDLLQRNNITQTQVTLRQLGLAISSTNISPAPLYQRHYQQDVGALPGTLNDLLTKPGTVSACTYTATTESLSGWCGPYWSVPYSGQNAFSDSWNNTINYDAAGRRIYSNGPNGINEAGGGDDIVQNF